MTTVGITMVRDEADIIESTLRHMATQVDAIIVADNRSVDATPDILLGLSMEWATEFPLAIKRDDEVGYEQSRKMTQMAHDAHEMYGADWIVPFDADEIWMADGVISEVLAGERAMVAPALLFDHVCTGFDFDIDDPVQRMGWRRLQPAPLPKVACRWTPDLVIGMGNHDASYGADVPVVASGLLTVHHFPYRSVEQVIRKVHNGAEAYAATDLPEHFGAHWRQWGVILDRDGPEAIEALFRKWYYREDPSEPLTIDGELQPPLLLDPIPHASTMR